MMLHREKRGREREGERKGETERESSVQLLNSYTTIYKKIK